MLRCPLRKILNNTVNLYPPVVAAVVFLFVIRCPLAIFWFIIPVVVYAVN